MENLPSRNRCSRQISASTCCCDGDHVKPEWRFVSGAIFCAAEERTVLERRVLERTDGELRAAHRVATYPQTTVEIPVRWTANAKGLSFLPAGG